jgi:hypothetical protein
MPHIGQADPTLAHRNSTGRSGVSSPHRRRDAVMAVLAGSGVAEATCISLMSNALNGAACALLLTTALVAIVVARSHLFRSWEAALPSLLAGLTLLTLVAIMASGSKAQTGLIFAVAVVAASGATWLLLGRTLWRHPNQRSTQAATSHREILQ